MIFLLKSTIIKATYHLPLLLIITTLYAFLCLGAEPIYLGDEARGGINALEMMRNGDYINLHFAGAPDAVRSKPPLFIWMVVASMRLFGENAFALRFPAAVCVVGAFFFIYRIIRLYCSSRFALAVGLVLLSVRGLVGWHVGRTGDFDAPMLLFLMAGVWFLLRWLDFGKRNALFGTSICWGIAFFVKGPAMGALLPGLILYLLLTPRFLTVLKNGRFWTASLLFSLFPIAWFLLIQHYGVTWTDAEYTGRNAFERLFVHDLYERFTEADFERRTATSSYDYILYSLDKMFNLWNYLFFGWIGYGIFRGIKQPSATLAWLRARPLLLLSLCLWFPYAIILSSTTHALQQYIVPVLPFVGIATAWGADWLYRKRSWMGYLFVGLLLFTLGRRLYEITHPRPELKIVRYLPEMEGANRIFVETDALKHNELLYLYFANREALHFDSTDLGGDFDYLFLRRESPRRDRFDAEKIGTLEVGEIWRRGGENFDF